MATPDPRAPGGAADLGSALRRLAQLGPEARGEEEGRLAALGPEAVFPALREVLGAGRPEERPSLVGLGRRVALDEFRRLASTPEDDLPLDQASLAIARWEYPDLDPAVPLAALRGFARRVRMRLAGDRDPVAVLEGLNEVLFTEEAFRGNQDDYYDPRNSFLNDVLARRVGVPLTLSIVMVETARRLGLPLQGIGLPGHFVVRLASCDRDLYLDPFDRGRFLSLDEIRGIVKTYAGSLSGLEAYLRPCPPRAMLVRLLHNLKAIYLKGGEAERALAALDRILALKPDLPSDRRDRGLLLLRMLRAEEARADLERYLRLVPEAPDARAIRELLGTLDQRAAERN